MDQVWVTVQPENPAHSPSTLKTLVLVSRNLILVDMYIYRPNTGIWCQRLTDNGTGKWLQHMLFKLEDVQSHWGCQPRCSNDIQACSQACFTWAFTFRGWNNLNAKELMKLKLSPSGACQNYLRDWLKLVHLILSHAVMLFEICCPLQNI